MADEQSKLVREFIDANGAEYAELDAVRWLVKKDIHSLSYGELKANATNIRRGLLAEGFDHAHVSLIGTTTVEWICAYLGIITGNCAAIPLDPQMPVADLVPLVNRSDSTGLFLGGKCIAMLPALLAACPQLERVWVLEGELPAEEANDERVETLATLMERGAAFSDDVAPARDDLAMIIFTSGTTGLAKGVMLSQHNLAENVKALSFKTGIGVPLLNVLPIHHAFCLVMDWLRGFNAAAVICINDSFIHMVRNMSIFKPKSMLMVPLMIETLYKRLANADPSLPKEAVGKKVFGGELHFIFSGGAHLEPEYIEKLAEYGVTVLEGYGMSECSPVISANMPYANKPGSVGKPLPNVELAFSDEGEVLVKGTSVMKEYYKMPAETGEALRDGWLHTGDKGYLDDDGFLFLNGRLKNLIILANGENVSPEEIEGRLALSPLVGEIVVTGEGTGLVARIWPDKDAVAAAELDEDGVKAALQDVLDAYNTDQPSYRRIVGLVVRQNPFVKTATRKIVRDKVLVDEPQA